MEPQFEDVDLSTDPVINVNGQDIIEEDLTPTQDEEMIEEHKKTRNVEEQEPTGDVAIEEAPEVEYKEEIEKEEEEEKGEEEEEGGKAREEIKNSQDINIPTLDMSRVHEEIVEETKTKELAVEEKKEETKRQNENSFCLPPVAAWTRGLQENIPKSTEFRPTMTQLPKLLGLGYRMGKYVKKTIKEGKDPFMNPSFIPATLHADRGVPCGGIGCGSISRSWNGKFNQFYLNPGRPSFGTVKANQFSLYVKRKGHSPHSSVLGLPVSSSKKKTSSIDDDTIAMPHAEPFPDAFIDKINTKSESGENEEANSEESNEMQHDEKMPVKSTPSTEHIKTTYIHPMDALKSWNWQETDGTYHGLFPRAWTTYNLSKIDKRLEITCKQISPVIPDNYKESSYPCSVFVWEISNTHPSVPVDVSLMFSFQNGTGDVEDYTGGHFNQPFHCNTNEESPVTGVEMVNNRTKVCVENGSLQHYNDPLSMAISTIQAEEVKADGSYLPASSCQRNSATCFQTTGNGEQLWRSFSLTGKAILPDKSASSSLSGIGIGAAVTNKVSVPPQGKVIITFSLAWDQPIIRFGEGRGVHPRYTRFYGTSGRSVQQISEDALKQWRNWDQEINLWQEPILSNPSLPHWYKTALFNELYYIVAGGSLWIDKEEAHASRVAHQIRSTQSKTNAPTTLTLSKDKAKAMKILEDFITLTENIEKGIIVTHKENGRSGRIIFSPKELEMDVPYLTANGNSLMKKCNGTILLANSITLYPSDDPNSPPVSPRGNPEETCEESDSLFDYGEFGIYLYLEGQEYLMYNTYDVHFYASFALISLWPELELNLQRNVARSALIHSPSDLRETLHSGELCPRKLRGAVPHDVGTPSGDPIYTVNSYCIHDVNHWKDLNSKFTLQVYRDFVATKNKEFLAECYPVVWECMHYLERFDTDRDGMIENSGFPDQTYDTWTAAGPSAYCGGLWVASLSAMVEMATILGKEDDKVYYEVLLERASAVYETLWNGEFFRYDATGSYDDIIMADQLAGQWYARASGLPAVAKEENIRKALQSVFTYNVKGFHDGTLGAVNGFNKTLNTADYTSMQSSEVWTGTTFALAANMIQEGLLDEGWATARSLYECIYEKFGYWYQTPEAWNEQGRYRSYAYMRPLAIWSIQWALTKTPKQPSE